MGVKEKSPDATVLGLDVSTKTGWAVVGPAILQYGSWKTDTEYGNRFDRWRVYVERLEELLSKYKIELAVIEGYGYANRFTFAPLVEIGGLLRDLLTRRDVPWVELPPTSLKAYATGQGRAKKYVMIKSALDLLGVETKDDDACDALWLATFGRHLMGSVTKGLPYKSYATLKNWRRIHKADPQLVKALFS